MERDWGRVAIPPTIYRVAEPEFPKIAAETAGALAGKLGALGGVLGELLRRLPLLYSSRLRTGFGRMGFFAILIFGAPDFSQILLPDCFFSFFVGESSQKNPPGKSPTKPAKFYTTKIPNTFLQRGRAKKARQSLQQFLRVSLAVPQQSPCTAVFWEFGLRGLVDGRGNSKGREDFFGKKYWGRSWRSKTPIFLTSSVRKMAI